MLSLRLSDYCDHSDKRRIKMDCGHVWCELCGGCLDARTRVAFRSPGPVIARNGKPRPYTDYAYLWAQYTDDRSPLSCTIHQKMIKSRGAIKGTGAQRFKAKRELVPLDTGLKWGIGQWKLDAKRREVLLQYHSFTPAGK